MPCRVSLATFFPSREALVRSDGMAVPGFTHTLFTWRTALETTHPFFTHTPFSPGAQPRRPPILFFTYTHPFTWRTALEITYVGGDATYERLLQVCGRTFDFVDVGPRYVMRVVVGVEEGLRRGGGGKGGGGKRAPPFFPCSYVG